MIGRFVGPAIFKRPPVRSRRVSRFEPGRDLLGRLAEARVRAGLRSQGKNETRSRERERLKKGAKKPGGVRLHVPEWEAVRDKGCRR